MEEISNKSAGADSAKAYSLLHSIQNPGFILALATIRPVFSMVKNFSVYLQNESCDLSSCVSYASDLKCQLQNMRSNSTTESQKQFENAKILAKRVDVEIKAPRRTKSDENYENDAQSYFRRFIFIPFVDHLICEFNTLFLNHENWLTKIQNIIPYKCATLDHKAIKDTVKMCQEHWATDIHTGLDDFEAELTMWTR